MASTTVPSDLGSILTHLRKRRGVTQKQLAKEVGLADSSTISRLERGKTDSASLDLIQALSAQLEDDGQIWAAAGAIPGPTVEALAPHWRAFSPTAMRYNTLPAVRRSHLRALAEDFLSDAPGVMGRRVNTTALALAAPGGRRVRVVKGAKAAMEFDGRTITVTRREPTPAAAGTYPSPNNEPTARPFARPTVRPAGPVAEVTDAAVGAPDADNAARDEAQQRFLVAHAVAHIILKEDTCTWPFASSGVEEAAVDLACYLLVPAVTLASAYELALAQLPEAHRDTWNPHSGVGAAITARLLLAPAWVVIRRLAEDDLLHYTAQDNC